MYLLKAKELLNSQYDKWYMEAVTEHEKDFMNEKIRHSYQVLGLGNYLLKHENCFFSCLKEEKEYLQAIVLLHDVARFYEILEKRKGIHIDHGVYGAKMLSEIADFNRIEGILPVRHHGHLIEKLYEDEDYQSLSDEVKDKVKRNTFLVRDADKLANFYLIVSHFDDVGQLFFCKEGYENPCSKQVNCNAQRDFMKHKTITLSDIDNFAVRALAFIAWIFDLNYGSSFAFIEKMQIIDKMFQHFSQFLTKKDCAIYRKEIDDFIRNRIG